jgi:hypothetical protein
MINQIPQRFGEDLIAGSAKALRDPQTVRMPVPTLHIYGTDTQSVAVSSISKMTNLFGFRELSPKEEIYSALRPRIGDSRAAARLETAATLGSWRGGVLSDAGAARPSRSKPRALLWEAFSLNRSDFKIERDHFMHRNRGDIDGDEAVLIRERNWPACHQ